MITVSVQADIDPWDVIEELDEEQLADYLRRDGWHVSKMPFTVEDLDYEDLNYILEKLSSIPLSDWQGNRIADKIRKLRFG